MSKGTMTGKGSMEKVHSVLREGMGLAKCRRCGCMKETLETLRASLPLLQSEDSSVSLANIQQLTSQLEPIKYACLGCEYCFPAVAMNLLNQAFPEMRSELLSCGFEVRGEGWPPVPGEYFSFCEGPGCPVAVSTLASVELAETLASDRPAELCIVGKTETENIGIDKLIKNTITNRTIRFLLLVGKEPQGHHSGRTLLALWKDGVDSQMRVIGSPGRRPILRNVSREEVEAFRKQVQVVDAIGFEDAAGIIDKVKILCQERGASAVSDAQASTAVAVRISTAPVIQAKAPTKVEMDGTGYFVIIPQPEKGVIIAEHYSYENTLLRVIEGKDAKSIYTTIVENQWVTQTSHAAYIGKELARAELSIKLGFKYIQDGA